MSPTLATYVPGGIQSGPDSIGSTYASSAIYNINDNTVYITGATYGNTFDSNGGAGHVFAENNPNDIIDWIDTNNDTNHHYNSSCFLTVAKIPTEANSSMYWVESQIIQNNHDGIVTSNQEICTGMLRHSTDKLIMIGYTDNVGGSTLESLILPTVIPNNITGMMIQLDYSQLNNENGQSLPVVGGEIIDIARVTYPLEMFGRPGDSYLYVVSQYASNTYSNPDFGTTSSNMTTDPFEKFPLGTPVSVQLNKFAYKTVVTNDDSSSIPETFDSSWTRSISSIDRKSVYVSGITELNNTVIIVGYTSGKGDGIAASDNDEPIDGTFDGFITKVSIKDGKYVNQTSASSSSSMTTSRRIKSINSRNEQIMGLCTSTSLSSSDDNDALYVVGWTEGYFDTAPPGSTSNPSKQAFLMKLHPYTLDTLWTYQVGVDDSTNDNGIVKGISCIVSSDNQYVYFGGNIENDGVLKGSGLSHSYGKTDIFLIKLKTIDNTVIWTNQFGSDENDEIGYRNGLLVDDNDNPIVIGNTYGSIYRPRQNNNTGEYYYHSDIFVATVDGTNGNMKATIQHQEPVVAAPVPAPVPDASPTSSPSLIILQTSEPTAPLVKQTSQPTPRFNNEQPFVNLTDDEIQNQWNTLTNGNNNSNVGTTTQETNDNNSSTTDNKSKTIWSSIVMTVFLMIVIGGGFVFYANQRYSYKEVATDRTKVLGYMSCFDVEEIDLKHSATGGWHCSYTGNLARGINTRDGYHPGSHDDDDDHDDHDPDTAFIHHSNIDPLDPTGSFGASSSLLGNTSATKLLLSSSHQNSYEKISNDDHNNEAEEERSGILRSKNKNKSDSFYSDRDNNNNIASLLLSNNSEDHASVRSSASRRSSSSRKSTSSISKKKSSNKEGYESLINEYSTTWDQTQDHHGSSSSLTSSSKVKSTQKSGSSIASTNSGSSGGSKRSSNSSSRRSSSGTGTWGKDIV